METVNDMSPTRKTVVVLDSENLLGIREGENPIPPVMIPPVPKLVDPVRPFVLSSVAEVVLSELAAQATFVLAPLP